MNDDERIIAAYSQAAGALAPRYDRLTVNPGLRTRSADEVKGAGLQRRKQA